MLGLSVVVVPVILGLAFRLFPETSLGRRVLPAPPEAADVVPDTPRRQRARELVGLRGRATSDLLPWGTVTVGSDSIEGLSEGGPIDAGADIIVVAAQGAAVVVRRAAVVAGETGGDGRQRRGPTAEAAEPAKPADGEPPRLSATLENFTFESFEPPDA
jgi:membrane protein implicated in regulation of membrane protease activity